MSKPASVRTIDAASIVHRVTDELRGAILTGRLQPEQALSLREIAEKLGVSYIPVREALRILEGDGLLHTHRGRSARVAPMTSEEVVAILRLRRQIEPKLAAMAVGLHSRASLDDIASALARCDDPSLTTDQHRELHQEVHLNLIRPALTVWDGRVIEPLLQATSRYLRLTVLVVDNTTHVRQRQSSVHIEAHLELLDTLRASDARHARDIMLRHLDDVEHEALAAFGEFT